jgi:hypothetical protein
MTRGETAAQHASTMCRQGGRPDRTLNTKVRSRDPRDRQCRALLPAEMNGPEVAQGKARIAGAARRLGVSM